MQHTTFSFFLHARVRGNAVAPTHLKPFWDVKRRGIDVYSYYAYKAGLEGLTRITAGMYKL